MKKLVLFFSYNGDWINENGVTPMQQTGHPVDATESYNKVLRFSERIYFFP
jgi:hypothetical protein